MASFGKISFVRLLKHQKTLKQSYSSYLFTRNLFNCSLLTPRSPSIFQGCCLQTSAQLAKSKQTERIDPLAEPIQYSTSDARTWKARENLFIENKAPFYQPFVVILSVGAILVYFCILREENDIDDELNSSLFQRIPGLEEKQLKTNIQYYQKHGQDTTELENRLQEIRDMGPAARRVQD